jgi:hypothetical protein
MTRRQFLYNSSAAMAVLAAFPGIASGKTANTGGNFQSMGQIGYSQLAAQIHTPFRVCTPSGRRIELTLLKAPLTAPSPLVPGRRPAADAANEKFSLVFSGPRDALLPAAIHPFEHDELGRFSMYIGPIGPQDSDRVRYQSVFNRPALEAQIPS